MAEPRVIFLAVEVLGVETGHWCNACMLPSGIRVWYVTRTGVAMTFRHGVGCMHCDSEDIELTESPTTIWES